MAVTGTQTCTEIATDALRYSGVVAVDLEAADEEIAIALRELDRMLKSWQAMGHNLWTLTSQTVTLTTAASYTLSPVRPFSIHNINFRQNGRDLPMHEMMREEYDSLPVKTASGIPTNFYYDRQREDARLYVWPVLSVAAGETLEITFYREIEDVVSDSVIDCPAEWYDAVVKGLGFRLTLLFSPDTPKMYLKPLADEALALAMAGDRESSVYFRDA